MAILTYTTDWVEFPVGFLYVPVPFSPFTRYDEFGEPILDVAQNHSIDSYCKEVDTSREPRISPDGTRALFGFEFSSMRDPVTKLDGRGELAVLLEESALVDAGDDHAMVGDCFRLLNKSQWSSVDDFLRTNPAWQA